jgi:2-hydroxychromene-2-carboxylate isomerase
MWRDLERRAGSYGIPIALPVQYPLEHFDRANRIAILAADEGWCEPYVRATYRHWFQAGLPAGGDDNLLRSLEAAGQDAARVLAVIDDTALDEAYETATDTARSLGVFGSPSFVVGSTELFWGDDRLEDAIGYAKQAP